MEHPARAHLRARDVPPGFGVGGVGGADRSTADVERGVYKCLFRQTVQEKGVRGEIIGTYVSQ